MFVVVYVENGQICVVQTSFWTNQELIYQWLLHKGYIAKKFSMGGGYFQAGDTIAGNDWLKERNLTTVIKKIDEEMSQRWRTGNEFTIMARNKILDHENKKEVS